MVVDAEFLRVSVTVEIGVRVNSSSVMIMRRVLRVGLTRNSGLRSLPSLAARCSGWSSGLGNCYFLTVALTAIVKGR
jgi:hypothetical protein